MIFHVLYLDDTFLDSCFYAIKLLAQARKSRRPHITVRGPFEKDDTDLKALNDSLAGNRCIISGVDQFESEDRRVIYFKCHSDGIKKVWYKPSFPVEKYGLNPHLTVYDGPKDSFSESLLTLGKKISSDIEMDASRLERFVSGGVDDTNAAIKLLCEIDRNPDFSEEDLGLLNANRRLELIKDLLLQLKKYI